MSSPSRRRLSSMENVRHVRFADQAEIFSEAEVMSRSLPNISREGPINLKEATIASLNFTSLSPNGGRWEKIIFH